ncbi:pantothenate transporter [Penicillium atrosanguineum]|uniref:pantothenate transporter n=1 Tax=Penicillium atrosanguineum TaxID=1132637 RepID=UPI0023A4365A|nr:pantothenate transporter [Penicillium atrosanguineum]KAJ5314585.1 pantothenate transporter [Penicillium atrosanguineum]
MPVLRKLIVVAAVDGLVLHANGGPRFNGSNNEASSIRIDYKTNKITALPTSAPEAFEGRDVLESYGLVGLLSVASYSFLVSVTQREQVAQIQGYPVYSVTNVAIIPTSSQEDATRAITQARKEVSQGDPDLDPSSDEEDVPDNVTDGAATEIGSVPTSPTRETFHSRGVSVSSIAEDVIGKRLRFGRFAANWLSRKNLGLPRPGALEPEVLEPPFDDTPRMSTEGSEVGDSSTEAIVPQEFGSQSDSNQPGAGQAAELLPKLLRYTKLLFASHNFFFAYDYDLTRSYHAQGPRSGHLPLHKTIDPLYFWNKHLMTAFIDSDAHGFVLPLLQGFVGQRKFTVAVPEKKVSDGNPREESAEARIIGDSQDAESVETEAPKQNFLLTLISRRSVNRPGVRYLRRGVDDEGNTANTVETEQILSGPDWDPSHNVHSYLQVRGSIPLYFSQSPYAFKPIPVLHHSAETNQLAFGRHFRELSRRYGKIQAVSLIDKHAGELKVGEQYERYADVFNKAGGIDGSPLRLEWFDFHNECRGMKFENVSRLVDRVKETLDEFGYTTVKDGAALHKQVGIVRTNCMDCLDRTGVAQCALGQWALERQLKEEGIQIDFGGDSSTQWFNTLWADNGDAISKQYSSTAALKGDYTRTRKRDYRGALNDFGLTLSRYYNNIVNDYFSQACIDYLLGNVSTHVFDEFAMELQTTDPGISVQKIRQNAIDTSCKIVISSPSEEFLGGWTMLTPRQPNTLRTLPFEESVLLLTDAAVYSCRFDWETDKVLSFERIDLRSISRIHYGTYITSILTDTQANERSNVGLVVVYRDGDTNALRVNTRSLQTNVRPAALETTSSNGEWDLVSWLRGTKRATTRFVAFKSMPMSNPVPSPRPRLGPNAGIVTVKELDRVRGICQEIERAMLAGDSQNVDSTSVVEQSDIISLADAKKRTGILEYLVYDIKKMVWA